MKGREKNACIPTCLISRFASRHASCVACGTLSAVWGYLLARKRSLLLGPRCRWHVVRYGGARSESVAQAAATAGLLKFAAWKAPEHLDSTSELPRVNTSAGSAGPCESETLTVVERAFQIAEMTDGGFNIAIGPAVDAWSVIDARRIPTESELEALRPLVDLMSVHVDVREQTIYLGKAGMRIDVGGIGKGYAADQAVEALRRAGAIAGVVALSGDIKTFGRLPGGKMFPVGIQHPRKDGSVLAWIDLQDEAISTAGDYERFFEREGVRYHHILDPRTLQPARSCQSVTVVAREGIWADGLDTGIFVMGVESGMRLVEALPDVEAIIVDHEGHVHVLRVADRIRKP